MTSSLSLLQRCLTGAAEADADVGERRRAAAEDRERARQRPAEEGAPAQQRTGLPGRLRAREALIVARRADARTPRAARRRPRYPVRHPLVEVTDHVERSARRLAGAARPGGDRSERAGRVAVGRP